jgi:hypothetical protein
MGMERARNTGLPLVQIEKDEYLDSATLAKRKKAKQGNESSTKVLCEKCFGHKVEHKRIAYNIESITKNNDWIAIIHADGNGLGQVVQKIGGNAENFKKFSKELNNATIEAAVEAYNHVVKEFNFNKEDVIPIRPIVLGGDDLTLICRADFAIDYTREFLKAFETKTHAKLGEILKNENVFHGNEHKLTACAGIAFIKSSFPFYYGYELAEELCKAAKKDAKKNLNEGGLPKSCLMFHKVQDSFVVDFDEISKRELSPNEQYSFKYGPYYINEGQHNSVKTLLEAVQQLNTDAGNAVKSHLRQWISMLHENPEAAEQKLKRLRSMLKLKDTPETNALDSLVEKITQGTKKDSIIFLPVYDILSLNSVINQDTKSKVTEA